MLWLSLHLPQLPLEVFTRGVASSLSAAAAQAPAGKAGALHRDRQRERSALAGLAAWAGQFSTQVSLEDDGLLLEVSAYLRQTGGVAGLADKVRNGVKALGYHAVLAGAPTPLGAALLARAGEAEIVTDHAQWAARLACLPIALFDEEGRHCDMLDALGVGVVGDYLALPRASLKRRFGPDLIDRLDRALGVVPDPRETYAAPARFAAQMALPADVAETGALAFAAKRLLLEMEGYLRGRSMGVQQFHLELRHPSHGATRISIVLAVPGRDSQRLLSVLRERLERVRLPQPVREIALMADHTCPYQPRNRDPFAAGEPDMPPAAASGAPQDETRVPAMSRAADSLPVAACGGSGIASAGASAASRPMWLLPQPRPLATRGGVPQLGMPLILRQGPQRMDHGWRHGRSAARDYYVAETVDGPCYWVYREAAGAWYLHGIFS